MQCTCNGQSYINNKFQKLGEIYDKRKGPTEVFHTFQTVVGFLFPCLSTLHIEKAYGRKRDDPCKKFTLKEFRDKRAHLPM